MCKHYVYAVIRSTERTEKVKVSKALSWGEAQDRWSELDGIRYVGGHIEALATPIAFFAVRSADDPDWPRRAYPRHVLTRNDAGEFINL